MKWRAASMWLKQMFGVEKPVIALLHLRALPGDPRYGEGGGSMAQVVRIAGEELKALQDGGVDGILFANEFSLPYQHKADYVTVAAMALVIGELKRELKVPYGVNVVLNPMASIELAAATNADFVRNTFTGAYIGESGITDTDIANVMRRKYQLGMKDLKMLFKVNPESDVYLAERDLGKITKSMVFHCFPDGLCVSGSSAGSETDENIIREVKKAAGQVPVFCNTGCTRENIIEKLEIADGACVGTAFKADGKFDNFVEPSRVKEFMDAVKQYRRTL